MGSSMDKHWETLA